MTQRVVAEEFDVADLDVVARSTGQVDAVVTGNPWPEADTADLHVLFLDEPAHGTHYAALDLTGYEPEQLIPGDGHVWLRLPGGVGRSKLVKDLPRLLLHAHAAASPTTMRNWRTVCALRTL